MSEIRDIVGYDDAYIWVSSEGAALVRVAEYDLGSEAARFTPDSILVDEPPSMAFDPLAFNPLAYDPFMDRPSEPKINFDRAAMYGPGFQLEF